MTTQAQIKEKNKLEKYKKSRKTYKSETGITIVTLVITIIVLLILSGITITALSGDNGILKRAAEAKQETEKNQVIEMVQLEVLGTYAEADGEFDSEKFKDNVKDHLKNYNPVISEDEKTITVEVKKYEVVVDKETGEVVKKGEVKGVTPIFETKLYNEDGTELKGEGKGTVIVGVKLTNKEKLDKYSIEIKNSKGEKIEADTTTIGEGEVSFTIEENGKYTIIVKGTKDGTERTNQRTIEIDVGEKIITNIEIRPNGGAKYIVPTEGKAKIKVEIEEKAGENKYKYSYGWSTDETEKPTTWTETASKAEIEKTDCEEGKYYLWIKVVSEKGNEKYIESNKFEVISNRKITIEANTKEITNKDVKLKINYDELLTENRNIEVTGKRGTDYEINGENEVIIKTNNQTITVSATDIAGNKITEKTIISNIDKAQPVVTFGTNGSTSYKKSQSTTVTVKSIGVSTIVANSLKYQWTQSTTAPAENTFSTTFTSGETITKTDGTGNNWYLWILAKNTAGTTIITKSNAFYLDNTAPNTTAPTATGTTNTVVVTFAQTDAHSGIDESTRQYSIKKTSDSSWGTWVTDNNVTHTFTNLTLNTEYQVRTQVKDIAGNGYTVSGAKAITTVNITKPTITLSTTAPTNQNITATITYPEITGLTKQYSYDNKTWTTYKEPLTIDANKTIYARSIDSTNQGSDSTRVASLTVTNIDKTQPIVTFGTNGNTTYKKSQSTTVTVTNSGTSTVNASSLKYQWTQSTTAPSENTFSTTFTSGGTITKSDGTGNNWYLWILAKNTAGNTTIVKSNVFYLDNTAPNTTAPTATSTTNSIVVTSAQADSNSGIDASTRQYSIKKTSDSSWGAWITDSNGTHTFTNLTLNTEYQVRTQVKDALGNGYAISAIKTITTVNITKPTITLSTTSPTNKSITATITYPEITGLTKQYSYDNKTWTTYTAPLTIDTNKTIYARSIDSTNQGSDSTRVASLTVTNIDKTQPTVTFGTNGSTSYKKSQSTTVTVTNAGTSTVNASSLKYQWTQSTTAPAENTFSTTFTSGGTITKSDGTGNNWYLWILAKNTAGNATIVKSNVFYLDNTAPNTTAPTATSTTNSIVVTSAQTDSHSGINASTRQYSIKKTSDSSWGSWVTDSSNTHTFTNLTLNTEYQVRTQVKDALGNGYAVSGAKAITTVNITKPTITLSTTSPTNKSITATITYPEITGITKQYSFDNKTWTTYTAPLTIDTNKTIYARSIDSTNQGSDSTRVASLTVTNIDKTQPTVTFGTNGSTSYKKSQSTTVTVTNAGTSTVNASSLKYQWTQSTTAPAESSFTATFASGGTITKSEGTGNNWYLWILAKDKAGNTTIVKSNVFYLDNTAPNTTMPTATSTTNSIVVTSAQTDAHSGIDANTRQYSIKKTSDSSWGSWVTDSSNTHTFTNLTLNTEYQVRTQVKDAVGNGYAVSETKTITTVNITKPTITLSTTAPTNQNITATITYPEITGLTKQYSYDNKTWTTYTAPLTIDTNKTIYARSIDSTNQGSDSTRVASLTVTNIDKTQPTVTFGTNGNTSYKKSQSTTVTVTNAGTSTVNASSLKYQWTQSTTAPAESSFTATFTSGGTITKSDGTGNNWYLWILAKNIAGNTTIVKSNVFYLDNIAPNTTAPTATSTTNSIVVTSAQTDAHSGIDTSTRQYSIKKTSDSSWGSWVTDSSNTHTFTNLTLNTEYQVRTQVKDALGNGYAISATKTITTVNITKPTITLSTTSPTNKSITATITYPNITGLTKQYSYDNKTWTTYTSPLTIDTNKTIYARSIDSTNQGSDSTRVASLTVTNIDKTQPTVTFGTNGNTSYKKAQSTTVTVSDASGINTLKYQWLQSATAPAESSFTATFTSGGTITKSDGTGNNWYLWILAKDKAGNIAIVKSNAFYLDNTAPNTTAPTATSTTNSIVVTSAQTDANSGINASTRQYSIKKTSDSSWGSWVTDSNGTHTFTNLTLNTEYQVRTQVKDVLGNGYAISGIKTITTVNITKPTITLSTTSPTNKSITATITYPNITGITKQYSYDNKTWTTYTTTLTIDTNKTIYARSIDSTNQGSDSTRVASLTVTNIDKTQPTVTFGTNGSTSYKKSQSTTVTVNDASGINTLKYQWLQSATAPAESSFTATFTSGGTITKSDGTGNNWYLWILAKDKAGNTTIVKSNAFYLDNTAPNTTAPTATSTTNSIVVTSAQTDSHSGIDANTRQYSIKKTSDSSWGAWITDKNNTHTFTNLTLNTEYQVRTQVKDALGNGYAVSGIKTITTVNITKPTITLSTTAPTNKSITATITYPEITGITKQYSFDNNIWITYTGPVTIENNRTIYARSIDSTNQGSDSTRVASLTVTNIDKTQPTVTFGTNGSTSYKKSQSTTVTVTNSGTSAVNASSLKYQWTQSTTAPAENTFSTTFTSGGTITKSDGTGNNWYLWILAKNTAGNTTIVKSNVFYLDNTAPNTTMPTATSTTNSIVVTSAQTDANSGINASTRQYSIKKKSDSSWGSWVTDSSNTHTFTNLTLNTEYQVRTQVKDAAGNGYAISATKAITTVNITKPTITLSTAAPTNKSITATITYPNITGITKQYSYDNKTWTKYTTALTIDTNKTIYARSIDSTNQGSDSTRVASLSVTNIDKTPPTVTHTIKNKKAKSVDIVITATDNNGIKSIANVTTTGISKTDTNIYTVTQNKDYEFKVTDNAGNVTNYTVTVTGITKVTLDAETIAKNPEDYYGKKVSNYTAGGKTYRIFYVDTEGKFGDKNTVYLKADWTDNNTTPKTDTPSGTDLETYKKLNPSWAAQRGNTNTSSWNQNERVAGWLCSPSQWATYCDSTKANYAIGSPPVEMYVSSYNQVSHTNGNYTLGATYRATKYPGYIYTVDGAQYSDGNSTALNTLDYIGYNSMYCGKEENKGEYYWRLASPSAGDFESTCTVNSLNAYLNYMDRGVKTDVCPLVSLKSDFEIEITLPSTIDAETIAENPGTFYGQKVTNYTAGGKTYRIFYVDTEGKFGEKNTIYLKADWTSNDTSLSDYTSYTPSGTDLEIYKKLNPSWAAQRGSSTSSWNTNEHKAAWLCSPSKWTTYCDTSKAKYAIGSPPVEMYVSSYNQVSHTTGNYKLGATYRETSYPGYIYTLNGKQSTISYSDYFTGYDTLDYKGYNSMYCKRNDDSYLEYYWWLASPSADYYGYVCYVDGYRTALNKNDDKYGACPLVALKPGVGVELENKIEITDAETIAENPQNYYGKKISNYTAGGQTYRIFYVDKQNDFGDGANTVYLKADYNDNLTKASSTNISSLTANDLAVYKRMNKSWAAQRGNSQSNWNSNENAAAWLSAPSQWTTYCDTTKANYAIGSPPVEMYVASYNQVSHSIGNYTLGATYGAATSYPGYIYTVNGTQQNSGRYTNSNTLDYTGYNSMYCGKNGSKGDYYWWLASPSASDSSRVCGVYGNNASLGTITYGDAYGVCPLVSLKSGIKLIITSE